MELARPLRGIITAMVTPLKGNVKLDHEGVDRLIEHLIGGGIHGLFILGTTGEAPSLPYHLRKELIERACKRVAGRIPVIVGITDTSYEEAIGVARQACDNGAAAVVAAPPFYYNLGQEDLLYYFRSLAADAPLPLFLYNAPSNTHHTIGVETVLALAGEQNIAGLKDSGSNMTYFHTVRQSLRARPEFSLLVGPEELLAEAVLLGGHGGMAAGSNVLPRLFVSLYEAAASGNAGQAAELHDEVMQFSAAIYGSGAYGANPLRGLKCALSVLGICEERTARPLRAYSNLAKMEVRRYLENSRFCSVPSGTLG